AGPSGPPQAPPAQYGPPPEPPPASGDGDPFTRAEHDTRATVAAPWWATAAPVQRQQALIARLVSLPDRSWWMYGAWARWYRWHPADGRWFPCAPPQGALVRRSARPAQPGLNPPAVPAEILPTGPDFAYDYGPPLAVAGKAPSGALTYRLRSVIQEAALAPPMDYPLGWSYFLHGTPSTVAATWSAMLWCASVPVFDPDLDSGGSTGLLNLWEPYLAQPFDDHGRLRWLVPPLLRTIIGLYAERMRAGRADAAGQIVRCMVMTAQALRDDPRFQVRASALLSIIEPLQANPALDHRALPYGDEAMEREWMSRCAPSLRATLFADTSPGERFQMAFYDLAEAVRPMCGDPESTAFTEPRHVAVALLAADMAGYRPDLAAPVGNWLDPELRGLLSDVLQQSGHGLRRFWPSRGRLPEDFRPADTDTALRVLSAAASVDFAWCRLAHGIPVPPDGFTVPDAFATALDTLSSRPATGESTGV
ncbi:MAG TPA: hypothetical protein VHJ17_12490, partial [Thermomonospora sp.]|nr:hypothetical protein [Thermomonospora sp.]